MEPSYIGQSQYDNAVSRYIGINLRGGRLSLSRERGVLVPTLDLNTITHNNTIKTQLTCIYSLK